ncbi:MAG TPA: hypothetical protein VFQ63_01700 [Patescibacteria group bacterium]|nr:hypothetical protein [Patescibacteria group bacterium]
MVTEAPPQAGSFRREERREINLLTRHPQKLVATQQAILTMRQAMRETPDISWSALQEKLPSPVIDSAPVVLEETFQRFSDNRQATTQWSQRYADSATKTQTMTDIKEALFMQDDISIGDIQFGEDYCVISLSYPELQKYWAALEEREGILHAEDENVWGFASAASVLRGDRGVCPVVFVVSQIDGRDFGDQSFAERIVPQIGTHEVEHGKANAYYFREETNRSASDGTVVESVAEDAAEKTVEMVRNGESVLTRDEQNTLLRQVIKRTAKNVLSELEVNMLKEFLADGASGRLSNPSMFLQIQGNVDVIPESGERRFYAKIGRDILEGYLQGLRLAQRQGKITGRQYASFALEVEYAQAVFSQKIQAATELVKRLWDSYSGKQNQQELFISSLYAIPPGQWWKIEYFLHGDVSDPKNLAQAEVAAREWRQTYVTQAHISETAEVGVLQRVVEPLLEERYSSEFDTEQQAMNQEMTDALVVWQKDWNRTDVMDFALNSYMRRYRTIAQKVFGIESQIVSHINFGKISDVRRKEVIVEMVQEYMRHHFAFEDLAFSAMEGHLLNQREKGEMGDTQLTAFAEGFEKQWQQWYYGMLGDVFQAETPSPESVDTEWDWEEESENAGEILDSLDREDFEIPSFSDTEPFAREQSRIDRFWRRLISGSDAEEEQL